MSQVISTFFWVGHLPLAPGTWASLVAIPIGALIAAFYGPFFLMLITGIAFGLGWWATDREIDGKSDHDPGHIVIDEVVGQWIALTPMALGIVVSIGEIAFDVAFNLLLAFTFFRVYDVMKPFPVSRLDRMTSALGVMLDDVAAGIMAALSVAAIAWAAG